MFVMKVCHACDQVLGELELDDLTAEQPDSIINVVGNVAYTLCPDCMNQLEVAPYSRLH
jgi:hypothetical protein